MVHSMASDRGARVAVAWLAIFVGCGPVVRPPGPGSEPGPVTRNELRPKPVTGGRQVMVGEMCPQGAGGRPAIAPLVMRTVTWNDTPADVASVVERGGVARFVVFGVDGKPAGVFETLGLVEIGHQQSVASGTYLGAGPCTSDGGNGTRIDDPKCGAATAGCGIALAEVARPDATPELARYATSGACLSGDALAVDIDGDGVMESFPIAAVLDGARSPAPEWTAAPIAGAACTPTFQRYDVALGPAEPGKADARHVVKLSVLGVIDVDADGRKELILALEFPTVRTIVVYTATGSPQRLELAGEGTPFQR